MISDQEEYNLPFDMTQDGIGTAIGISRAHTSLELKKLRNREQVKEKQVRVVNSNVRRKVYHLTDAGISEAESVKQRLKSVGIAFETILDPRYCNPKLMWAGLNASDRDVFGLVCVLRIPVSKESLPHSTPGVVPFTHKGMVDLSEGDKKRYLRAADPKNIRNWHSMAADWYIENGLSNAEKLYHLIKAGRDVESERLLVRHALKFISSYREDLLDVIKYMEDPSKTPLSSWSIRGKLAIYCKDVEYAETCARKLEELDSLEGDILRAEIKFLEGDYLGAYRDAKKLYEETELGRVVLIMGKSLLEMEEFDIAENVLKKALMNFLDAGDVIPICDILVSRANIAHKKRDNEKCVSLLNKALCSACSDDKKERVLELLEIIETGEEPDFNID